MLHKFLSTLSALNRSSDDFISSITWSGHSRCPVGFHQKKSSALWRRTKRSTQPFIYRISVSGKLSLYLHFNKYKKKSQDDFTLFFYVGSSSNISTFLWIVSKNRGLFEFLQFPNLRIISFCSLFKPADCQILLRIQYCGLSLFLLS